MLKAKISKAGVVSDGIVLVLGFVGEGVGVVRAICVDPVTGNARAHALHEVIFQPLASAEPMTKALQNAKIPEEKYLDEPTEENTAPDKPMDHTRPPWRQGGKKT